MTNPFQKDSPRIKQYKYAQLLHPRSIRLLKLQPDPSNSESSPTRITLTTVILDDHPTYESVSYTWASENGECERTNTIECNDDGFITVTANCEAALRRLRHAESERILWIDAICINQNDTMERSQQVTLMRDIYSNAKGVLVWLGNASVERDPDTLRPYSDIGFDYLYRLGAEAMATVDPRSDGRRSGPEYSALQRFRSLDVEDAMAQSADFRGLMTILSYGFWYRVWVIQELALAPSIVFYCGNAVLQGPHLQAFAWSVMLDSKQGAVPAFLRLVILYFIRGYVQAKSTRDWTIEKSAFLGFLEFTRGSSASDPRDQIYGIFGLIDENDDVRIPLPDYEKSLVTVYIEFALALIASTHSISVLLMRSKTSKIPMLPSWAPDWTIFNRHVRKPEIYNATKDSVVVYTVSADNTQLEIKGCLTDVIMRFADTEHNVIDDRSSASSLRFIHKWQQWCKLGLSLTTYPTGESMRDVLLPTLCNDLGTGTDTEQGRRLPGEFRDDYEAWYRILTSEGLNLTDIRSQMIEDSNVVHFYYRLLAEAVEQEFCITEKGFMALVPEETKLGDQIALLTGGRLPVVLRPCGQYMTVVGPCYVHGIMDGEAFPGDESKLEWITLR